MTSFISRGALAAVVVGSSAVSVLGANISISEPDYDRWNYAFAGAPATSTTASTFSDGGFQPFFDLRDSQFTNTYLTNDDIAAGQGYGGYYVTSAVIRATIASANGYILGGTGGTAPLELWRTGFRNGYNAFTFDNSAPNTADAFTPGTRNAFAADALGNDVSNNAGATPLAVGTIAGKGIGDPVANGDVVEFVLNISDPQVQTWLRLGLDAGALSFSVAALEAATQSGGGTYPRFATLENATYSGMSVDLVVIPAPGAMTLLGVAGLAVIRRRR